MEQTNNKYFALDYKDLTKPAQKRVFEYLTRDEIADYRRMNTNIVLTIQATFVPETLDKLLRDDAVSELTLADTNLRSRGIWESEQNKETKRIGELEKDLLALQIQSANSVWTMPLPIAIFAALFSVLLRVITLGTAPLTYATIATAFIIGLVIGYAFGLALYMPKMKKIDQQIVDTHAEIGAVRSNTKLTAKVLEQYDALIEELPIRKLFVKYNVAFTSSMIREAIALINTKGCGPDIEDAIHTISLNCQFKENPLITQDLSKYC